MSRIACLRIPRFPIAVHQKHEPVLKGTPFVLLEQSTGASLSRMRVLMCSEAASKKMVAAGMKVPVARSTCADLVLREYDAKLYSEERKKLVSELIVCSPRVSSKDQGIFLLDAQGLRLRGGENKLCRDLLQLASKNGFTQGRVGVADSAYAAMIATRFKTRRWYIVPAGEDAQFLAALPLSQLPLDSESLEILNDLGIQSIGQFTDLPSEALVNRFSDQVLAVKQLALGLDFTQPQIPVKEKQFTASVEIGAPLEALNETLFVLKSMLDRLSEELRQEKRCVEEIVISFYNDEEMFDERPVRLTRPSNQAKFLLELLRLSLESQPLKRQFTGIKLLISRFCEESWQQTEVKVDSNNELTDTIDSVEKSIAEARSSLLQRFAARLGDDILVLPLANDQYCSNLAGIWMPILDSSSKQPKPAPLLLDSGNKPPVFEPTTVADDYISRANGERGLTGGYVLKKSPEPIPVFVEFEEGHLVALTYRGSWYHVRLITTAECLSGLWWEAPFRQASYVALIDKNESAVSTSISNSLLVSLIYDNVLSGWFVDGVFD